MTKYEEEVINHLVAAWNIFVQINNLNNGEKAAFMEGIQKAQQVMLMRIGARVYDEKHPAPSVQSNQWIGSSTVRAHVS